MKPEISEEIISGWRREFEIYMREEYIGHSLTHDSFEGNFFYENDQVNDMWEGYLAVRKKAHSEREDAFKAFTLDLVDRNEKEIQKLKEEIEILKFERVPVELFNESEEKKKYFEEKHHEFANSCNEWKIKYDEEIEKRDKLLEQSYVTMKYFACVSDEIIERKDAEQWLKDFQDLKK